MSEVQALPTVEEVAERIRLCQEEMAYLRKLQRALVSARLADEARRQRQPRYKSETAHGR